MPSRQRASYENENLTRLFASFSPIKTVTTFRRRYRRIRNFGVAFGKVEMLLRTGGGNEYLCGNEPAVQTRSEARAVTASTDGRTNRGPVLCRRTRVLCSPLSDGLVGHSLDDMFVTFPVDRGSR